MYGLHGSVDLRQNENAGSTELVILRLRRVGFGGSMGLDHFKGSVQKNDHSWVVGGPVEEGFVLDFE